MSKEITEEEFHNEILTKGVDSFVGQEVILSVKGNEYTNGMIIELKPLKEKFILYFLDDKGDRKLVSVIGKPYGIVVYKFR